MHFLITISVFPYSITMCSTYNQYSTSFKFFSCLFYSPVFLKLPIKEVRSSRGLSLVVVYRIHLLRQGDFENDRLVSFLLSSKMCLLIRLESHKGLGFVTSFELRRVALLLILQRKYSFSASFLRFPKDLARFLQISQDSLKLCAGQTQESLS